MPDSIFIHNSHNVLNLVYHFVSSCGKNTREKIIKEYVKNQGKQDSYEQILLKL